MQDEDAVAKRTRHGLQVQAGHETNPARKRIAAALANAASLDAATGSGTLTRRLRSASEADTSANSSNTSSSSSNAAVAARQVPVSSAMSIASSGMRLRSPACAYAVPVQQPPTAKAAKMPRACTSKPSVRSILMQIPTRPQTQRDQKSPITPRYVATLCDCAQGVSGGDLLHLILCRT